MADSNNSHGNVKGFLQNLETIWANSLNNAAIAEAVHSPLSNAKVSPFRA
jgi:hypothetical protein